ncbi:MAG TPA: SGNH/GDSL hydrolase family protein [Bacteroidales bacterium]|nr:SGNH/GDSL hydrolase family protein [Bacteroidales bacterium]
MRKPKYILILSAVVVVFTVSFALIGSYFTSKIPFISTTGFYIDGIDYDDSDLISTWAESVIGKNKRQIYCFQQYRSSTDYIYQDWRKDFRFVLKANIVYIEMPDSIWDKVNTIWFKTGQHVIMYDKNGMLNNWICTKTDSLIRFTSGKSQIPTNSFKDGFKSFWETKMLYIVKVKYLVITALILAVFLIVFHFRNELYVLLKRNYQILRNKIKKNKSLWSKTFVVIAGTITAFILIEASLRILGYFHNKEHILKNYELATNAENMVICLGDSFTEGIGSTNGNTYPEVLERLVNSESLVEYKVANFGQSGKNTTQIKDEFFRYLDNHTPEMVILMAGSANYWNYYGFEDRNKFIYQLRTFKLIKLIWDELFEKTKSFEYYRTLFYTEDEYLKNRDKFYQSITNDSSVVKLNETIDSLNFFCNRDLIFNKILYNDTISFDSIFVSELNAELRQWCYIANLVNGQNIDIDCFETKYFRALYYYAKSFMVNKELKKKYLYLSVNEFPYLEDVYYQLLKSYYILPVLPKDFDQNRVCIVDSLDYYRFKLGKGNDFINIRKTYIEEDLELSIETKKINNWVKNDLEDIIIRCHEKGIKVILMTYPFKSDKPFYWPVNDIIRELSVLYDIKLIDNFEIFIDIEKDNETYYVSDGHCNDRGYRVISNEIYKLLKTEKLLKGLNNTDAE